MPGNFANISVSTQFAAWWMTGHAVLPLLLPALSLPAPTRLEAIALRLEAIATKVGGLALTPQFLGMIV